MPNPFFYGGHVQPDQFVGRKTELRRIFSSLETAHTGQLQSVSVVGPRRIGKSSLLYYVANRFSQHLTAPKNYRFAYIDLQDASTLTPDGLYKKILAELGALPHHNGKLTLAKFQDTILAMKTKSVLPVILLDEFEQILDHAGKTEPDLFDSWRSLINANAAAFITASKDTLGDLASSQKFTSPFFNVFTLLTLGELTNDEAMALIQRGENSDRHFGVRECNAMTLLAGNHPYKLQLAGSLIYDAQADGGLIDFDDVERRFNQQLEQAGLKPNLKRVLKSFGIKHKGTIFSGIQAAIKSFFDAWIDSMSKQR